MCKVCIMMTAIHHHTQWFSTGGSGPHFGSHFRRVSGQVVKQKYASHMFLNVIFEQYTFLFVPNVCHIGSRIGESRKMWDDSWWPMIKPNDVEPPYTMEINKNKKTRDRLENNILATLFLYNSFSFGRTQTQPYCRPSATLPSPWTTTPSTARHWTKSSASCVANTASSASSAMDTVPPMRTRTANTTNLLKWR